MAESSPVPGPWSAGRPNRAPGLPRVIGHRGAAAAAPENTLAGIRKAHAQGAAWVEFDVKLTRDGVPVLMHDDRLERTTDGRGRVRERTLAEIRALDAGGWFDPAFRGEPVPTFEETLALCRELGLGINVEIKPCKGREAETTEAAIAVLRAGWSGEAGPLPLISSFAHDCLAIARELAPAWPRGYLCGSIPRAWAGELACYGCATLHADHRRVRDTSIRALAAAGVPLLLYTVNDPAHARRLLDGGATAIITDAPDAVLAGLRP